MRARYYDADTGRFIKEDPIGIEGGLNVSLYAESDPIAYSDPSGLVKRTGGPPVVQTRQNYVNPRTLSEIYHGPILSEKPPIITTRSVQRRYGSPFGTPRAPRTLQSKGPPLVTERMLDSRYTELFEAMSHLDDVALKRAVGVIGNQNMGIDEAATYIRNYPAKTCGAGY